MENLFKADFYKDNPFNNEIDFIQGFKIQAVTASDARKQIKIWFSVISPIVIYETIKDDLLNEYLKENF